MPVTVSVAVLALASQTLVQQLGKVSAANFKINPICYSTNQGANVSTTTVGENVSYSKSGCNCLDSLDSATTISQGKYSSYRYHM